MSDKSHSALVVRRPLLSSSIRTGFAFGTTAEGALEFENLISASPRSQWSSVENRSTQDIADRLDNLRIMRAPSALSADLTASNNDGKSIAERLFDATTQVKILTSQVAMHMEDEWRHRLFRQLDQLHDVDEWADEDKPVEKASFATFLKAIFKLRPVIRPGLGLSSNGQLVAAWTKDNDRLTLQFQPKDRVKWVISKYVDGELEQVAGDTPVHRLHDALVPYNPNWWFTNVEKGSVSSK